MPDGGADLIGATAPGSEDLPPFRPSGLVGVRQPLRHQPLQVKAAHRPERRPPVAQHRVGPLQPVSPHDLLQQGLALLQRQGPHVPAFHEQHVERHVGGLPLPNSRSLNLGRPSRSSTTISPSNTYPGGRASSSRSNRLSRLPFFDSIRPRTVLAMPRKPSSFNSNR